MRTSVRNSPALLFSICHVATSFDIFVHYLRFALMHDSHSLFLFSSSFILLLLLQDKFLSLLSSRNIRDGVVSLAPIFSTRTSPDHTGNRRYILGSVVSSNAAASFSYSVVPDIHIHRKSEIGVETFAPKNCKSAQKGEKIGIFDHQSWLGWLRQTLQTRDNHCKRK